MVKTLSRRQMFLGSAALGLLPAVSRAEAALPPAKGPVLLTIDGAITRGNGKSDTGAPLAQFDADILDMLPQVTVETDTWWDEQPRRYRGPLLRDVLAACGADLTKGSFRAVAINDFAMTIPMGDVTRWPVLLARFMDEQPLPRRTKGPLWIMYPRRGDPDLERINVRHRWVWQLNRITVS